MSKGSGDRGSAAARRNSRLWCPKCEKMRGGSCNCSPLPDHPICNVLAEACGWDVQWHDKCECGNEKRNDEEQCEECRDARIR
jgi:hypothetical protein